MPVTFLAHQVPVIPIKERWPHLDGLALVVGSMAPDLWYVTQGWGWGPVGIPLWQDGHDWRVALTHWGLASLIMCVALRRWVLPVAARAVPDMGQFRLRDYWAVSLGRPRWWVTVVSGVIGGATHVLIDGFTHVDGFAVKALSPLQAGLFNVGARQISVFNLLQVAGSVGGAAVALLMLRGIGRRRQILRWTGVGTDELPPPLSPAATRVLVAVIVLGVALGVLYGVRRSEVQVVADVARDPGASVVVMSFTAVVAVAVLVSSMIAVAIERSIERSVGRNAVPLE